MILHRRSLLTGFVSFLAAPAVVRAASIMPVKALRLEAVPYEDGPFEFSGFYSLIPVGSLGTQSEIIAQYEAVSMRLAQELTGPYIDA